ncbi:DNA-methyltransferase [Spiroplasma citri]|uniref:Methyltransferase n=1 Tax=Spiroplasma citri TaxID=2133 RepID=A0AAJ4JYD0_SPICI|nr:site-specific DNA-methyltransferase [Spiroplasma citri]APE75085.1 DNA methylase [Spiroplasma citri]QED24969.1 site-specific DNA-methyltransferase [Spiroplasma citri]QIA67341.1 site-specific DNA-methyltransferase [Spiroplasma citri]QIA69000.1 site-specific DNA-methyltransferase [Spiroplasma citri]QIA69192.1 site-specific DNA-methyltransferase [Spiroplasma citri]
MFKTNLGKLINGDALEFIKTLENDSVDLILTDPPYLYNLSKRENEQINEKSNITKSINKYINAIYDNNLHNSFDINTYLDEFYRISKNKFMLIWMNRQQIIDYLDWVRKKDMLYDFILWNKTNPMPTNNHIYQDKEYCMIIYSKKHRIPNYKNDYESKKTIFNYSIGKKLTRHPTEKPLYIFNRLISKYSKENDLILDCFMGSGTTAYACEQLKRKWLGCEINNEYYKIIKKRLKDIQFKFEF